MVSMLKIIDDGVPLEKKDMEVIDVPLDKNVIEDMSLDRKYN